MHLSLGWQEKQKHSCVYYEQCFKLWLGRGEERGRKGGRGEERERREGGSIRPAGTTGEQDKSCSKLMC
ncbi:hypothetical protein GBAR_LOCUS10510 [Geodia barretti]|uniref:Uncharacterized protein n=1 Tax=Geodia barretti TaxID=519541 RepID=A0AA35RT55_GEOBA|nr:hypothetical protein GBAR_LOCUS10510 [Geodia barretti]